MNETHAVVAVFASHLDADDAVRKLSAAGIDIKHLSVVGKGYHTDEKVIGFYNAGDRIMFWGRNGAFWGALWGWLSAGIFVTVPIIGPVVVLGSLAAVVVSVVEGALVFGGLSALGAALYSVGVPKNSVLSYEAALSADKFLVMAHGPAEETARAKAILGTLKATNIDVHSAELAPAAA